MCIANEYDGFQKLNGNTKKKKKWKPSSNVSTFQRRDIATSRRLVNNSKSQRAAQRHDVPTSQRSHYSFYIIIKSTGYLILEKIEGCTDESEKRSKSNPRDRKDSCFCISLLKTINDL